MKTLISILVLFSTSLFAENNLPAPFGIQLGQPLADDIMCKSKSTDNTLGNLVISSEKSDEPQEIIKKKYYSLKNHIKKFGISDANNSAKCVDLLIPPKKNDKYNRYTLSVRGENLIVTYISASQQNPAGTTNLKRLKEYQKNLITIYIKIINGDDTKIIM